MPVQYPADFHSCLMCMQVFPPLHSRMSLTPALTEHSHLEISYYLYLLFNDTFHHYLTFRKNKLIYQLYCKTFEGTQANLHFQIYYHYCCFICSFIYFIGWHFHSTTHSLLWFWIFKFRAKKFSGVHPYENEERNIELLFSQKEKKPQHLGSRFTNDDISDK